MEKDGHVGPRSVLSTLCVGQTDFLFAYLAKMVAVKGRGDGHLKKLHKRYPLSNPWLRGLLCSDSQLHQIVHVADEYHASALRYTES